MEKICDNCMNSVPIQAQNCPECGIRFENTNPGGALPNGWVLSGRYTVGRYLDIDGEGVVYSAIDASGLARVNIKEFMPVTLCAKRDEDGSIISKPGCDVLFKTTRMDFAELYSGLLSLGETEGLVRVTDVFEENNTAYAVMEKLEGPTLAEYLLRMDVPLEYTKVISLLKPVVYGLEAMHAAGIIHRGISPENIILQSGGAAKLTGYATLALRQQGSELKSKLYEGYSAPEQYSASEFEGKYTDIYALAAVMFRMITGAQPKGADARKIQDTIRGVRSYSKDIPAYFSLGLLQAMRIAPAERFQSMGEFMSALSGDIESAAPGLFGLSKKQLIIAASALGAILLTLIIILFVSIFSGKDKKPDSDTSETSSETSSESSSDSSLERVMPNFINKKYADITDNAEYEDFIFAEADEVFDDLIEAGIIISQNPLAGKVWDGETPIKLTVSKGKELIELPDVVGDTGPEAFTEAQAKKILSEAGFTNVKVQTQDNDGSYTPGLVLSQSPTAGSKISPATEITITVSGEIKTVKMPNLKGLTEEEALIKLAEYGMKLENITPVANNGSYKPGVVLEQSIAHDTEVNVAQDTLSIKVAADVSLPNLVGMTIEQVDNEFKQLKDTVSAVSLSYHLVDEETSSYPAGTVIRTLKDGQTVKDGEQVVIYVAKAPPASSSDAGGE